MSEAALKVRSVSAKADSNGQAHLSAHRTMWALAVRWLIAFLLLSTAVLKAHQLGTAPVASEGLLTSRWFLVLLVQYELLLGFWLLFGPWLRKAWLLALASFGIFAFLSLAQGLRGADSCGCFGHVQVSPWIALVIDVTAVAALTAFRPRRPLRGRVAKRAYLWFGFLLLFGVPIGWATAAFQPLLVDTDGVIVGAGRVVVLEPGDWLGKPFPLIPHIDQGGTIAEGNWEVWLHRDNCPKCRQKLRRLSIENRHTGQAPLLVVDVPPFELTHLRGLMDRDGIHVGRLSSHYEWYVETPLTLHLKDGVVVDLEKDR